MLYNDRAFNTYLPLSRLRNLWHAPRVRSPCTVLAIRTDDEFNVIGEPEVFYCKPADDCLPWPGAVLITGITSGGTGERRKRAAFAARIHSLFTVPKTCILGYNNVRFDDEVTRNVFYRNFYDPYAWSWQHDNSRWDLPGSLCVPVMPAPEGINWPENDDGLPSFRLSI
ncbi:exonuclease domain-containing protein [Shigella flexneri]